MEERKSGRAYREREIVFQKKYLENNLKKIKIVFC